MEVPHLELDAPASSPSSLRAPAEEAAQRESDRRYYMLAEASPVGIFNSDADGKCIYLNSRCAEIAGVSPEEGLGHGWARHLHPDDRERVRAAARAARQAGTAFRSEHRFVHPDGRVVWALGQFVADRDPSGRLLGHVGTSTDITPLKHAEERLRQSEQRYQALAENSGVGIWQVTPDGQTLYLNPAMRRLLELDEGDDLAGRSWQEFFTPRSLERMRVEHQKRLAGVASTYEVELVARSGGRRVAVVAGAPILDAQGRVTSLIGTFTDITDRKRIERALRQNEMRLQVMAQQVPAVLWTTDAGMRFTSSLGAGLAGLGLKPDEVRGLSLVSFFHQPGRPEAPEVAAVTAHRRALVGTPSTYEQAWAGRVYHSHVEPLRGPDGSIAGVIGVALDITERTRAEQALREANDWLELRVEKRTEELTAANEALRRENEERKGVEEQLRQSQARYASILNSQQTLVSRSDPQGRITYQNAAHARTFGSKVNQSILVNVHPDDVDATVRAMEDLTHPPFTCTLEQRCEVRGQWRTFLWQGGVVRDRSGQVIEYQGVGFDITDRRRAEEMLRDSMRRAREAAEMARAAADEANQVAEFNRRLARELDHRVRNNLAGLLGLVSAMARQTRDVKGFAEAIEGRLLAMVHVHQVLSDTEWRAVDLDKLVRSLLAAVEKLCEHPIRADVSGPATPVSPGQALPLSMILLEWFANSCKYGAHSVPGGGLRVAWELTTRETPTDVAARHVRLRWTESCGPPVRSPGAPSLGTDLVKSFASIELRGTCELRFPPAGADHLLEFPLESSVP